MPTRTPLRVPARLVLCTLFLAAGNGACSFAFVDGPPKSHRQLNYFTCTSSNALPTVDLILGAGSAVEAVAFVSARSSGQTSMTTAAAVAAAEAAVFVASAIAGYGRTSDCREATDALQVRLSRMQLQAAPGFGPGQGPSPYQASPYDPWVTPRQGGGGASPPPGAGAPSPTPKSNPPPTP